MKLFYEKYIKLAHIGKGANAHVYKVKHAKLGYIRAIKVLNDYIEDQNEKVYQSFLKECRTLLTIGNGCHPNIVRIYGPALIDNHAVVEMDYVQGVTLDSYIKDKKFIEFDEVKMFIHDIVGALAYTHHDIYSFLMNPEEDNLDPDPNDGQKYLISPIKELELIKKYGISHNDLHSNNVMRRDYDGNFVLLDFGLAVQDGKCIKSSRMADGNPEYQAPEKFDSETISPRSDVYSLGILMYEILAGRVPFEIQYDSEGKVSRIALNTLLNQHLKITPPPILPFRKAAFEKLVPGAIYERDYPEWLDDVIIKCLAKKPSDRYADAKELLDVINKHLEKDIKCKSAVPNEDALLKSESTENTKNKIAVLQQQLSDKNREVNRLQSRLNNIMINKAGKNGNFLWKLTSIILVIATIGGYIWMDNKLEQKDSSTKALVDSLNNEINVLKNSANNKRGEIPMPKLKELTQQYDSLKSQYESNPVRNQTFPKVQQEFNRLRSNKNKKNKH